MMDKSVRLDALKQLDAGQITISQAIERHGGSERHWRRLLSTYRKPRPDSPRVPPADCGTQVNSHAMKDPAKAPDVKPLPGGAPVPPTMADIDKALAGGGIPGESKGPDPVLTADMALQGIRMAKMLLVVSSAEMLGIKTDEKTLVKLTSLQPVTETIIRMQKPEAWAKLGEMGSDPKALIGVLIMDTLIAGIALWRLMPKPELEEVTE